MGKESLLAGARRLPWHAWPFVLAFSYWLQQDLVEPLVLESFTLSYDHETLGLLNFLIMTVDFRDASVPMIVGLVEAWRSVPTGDLVSA